MKIVIVNIARKAVDITIKRNPQKKVMALKVLRNGYY